MVKIHETFAASVESEVVTKNHEVDIFRKLQYNVTFFTILKYDIKTERAKKNTEEYERRGENKEREERFVTSLLHP